MGEVNLLVGGVIFGEGNDFEDDPGFIPRASLTKDGILLDLDMDNSSEELGTVIRDLGVEGNRSAFGNVAIDESEFLYIVITKMTKFMEAGLAIHIFFLQSAC